MNIALWLLSIIFGLASLFCAVILGALIQYSSLGTKDERWSANFLVTLAILFFIAAIVVRP